MFKPKEILFISAMGLFYSLLPHWVDFDVSMEKSMRQYETCINTGNDYFFGVYPKQLLVFFRQSYAKNDPATIPILKKIKIPRSRNASSVISRSFRRLQEEGAHCAWSCTLSNYDRENYKLVSSGLDKTDILLLKKIKIPKKIHQIWLGPKKIPAYYEKYKKSWLQHHPDWEYKLWTDEDVKHLTLHNRDLYDQMTNWAGKADILRYEILYQYGGLYADIDIECIKSFEELNRRYDFYCGINPLQMFVMCVCNALIAAVPGHPILKHCIETMQYEKGDVPFYFKTGSIHLTKSIWEVARSNEGYMNIVFPPSYFYPIMVKTLDQQSINHELKKKPEAFCIHYWDANW